MKYLLLLLFAFPLNTIAQFDQEVFDTEWFLRRFRYDARTRPVPSNAEVYPITLNINEGNPNFITGVCSTFRMQIGSENAGTFNIVSPIEITGAGCQDEDNITFETRYFDFFQSSINEVFIISFTQNPNDADEDLLFITKQSGDEAVYSNIEILGTEENELYEITVHPNPTTAYLFIDNMQRKKLSAAIYNITGQTIKGYTEIQEYKINVSNLKNGVYFLKLEDELGNSKIEKFIKK